MQERPRPPKSEKTMPVPQIGPKQVVYEDRYRQIYQVEADFDSFSKEYFVVDSGQRVGLVLTQNGSVLLVRQYRLLLDGLSWEIPGGKVDEGETPEAAAIREALEETGILCQNLRPLFSFQPGLDSLHNPTHIFHADEFTLVEQVEANPREVWEHHWVPVQKALEMVYGGQIVDALSVVALLTYRSLGVTEVQGGSGGGLKWKPTRENT